MPRRQPPCPYHGTLQSFVQHFLIEIWLVSKTDPSKTLCVLDMTKRWQAWLSPRPSRRSNIAAEAEFTAVHGSALIQSFNDADTGRWHVVETHYVGNKLARDGKSGPPLHIHIKQVEYFEVMQGVMAVDINGTQHRLTRESGRVTVPRGARHRFWVHPDSQEDLVFRFDTDPQDVDNIFDERYLKNSLGYIADCGREGLVPSFPQLLLMNIDHGTVFTPPFWLPIWMLVAFHHVVGYWIGGRILGYKSSYPEYSDDPRAR
ncbi:hypothetical protein RB601_004269 [Gaeumannomyces tritici]